MVTTRVISRLYSSGKIVVCANGAIAAWHPPKSAPYEHTRSIDLSALAPAYEKRGIDKRQGPNNLELKEIFYTDRNEWYTRTREERLRSVAAPLPKKY